MISGPEPSTPPESWAARLFALAVAPEPAPGEGAAGPRIKLGALFKPARACAPTEERLESARGVCEWRDGHGEAGGAARSPRSCRSASSRRPRGAPCDGVTTASSMMPRAGTRNHA